jgi:putrescine carbamoyltransferase
LTGLSARIGISFEATMATLGGHALLWHGQDHRGAGDWMGDAARVLSRVSDLIEARGLRHQAVLDLAAQASVPVINGMSDYNHPSQALADLFTMTEQHPRGRRLEGCTVVFVGDRTNICCSLMYLTTKFGMHFVHAGPLRYLAPPDWLTIAEQNAAQAGHGSVAITDEVEDAVRDADFLYTDTWSAAGQGEEQPTRRAEFLPHYQVNGSLLALAPHARFMHPRPASRGAEVTDEVIDSPRSIVFDQAENLLHAQKALLAWFTHPWVLHDPPAELRILHEARIRDLVASRRLGPDAHLQPRPGNHGVTGLGAPAARTGGLGHSPGPWSLLGEADGRRSW